MARGESSESPKVQSRENREALKVKDRSGGFGGFSGLDPTTTKNMAKDDSGRVKENKVLRATELTTLEIIERSGGFGGSSVETPTTTRNMVKDGGGSEGGLDRNEEGAVAIEAMDKQRKFFKGKKNGRWS